ncbi:site-specific DNA-methyltransferase [Flavobacterium muglaense]|uniref:site-specific DNA-methyltransferase (adenine-specific) n=1 Tax=Flavobacterium muglaense TaxID=2764716 RepID=A0A923MYJ4_9FLAO|nr:site-specific DNA-methyltransferase [Flavobacterium muglaense]MBC5837590.1 site-specific DNA-methyltransferase [Flavobacterium muglaense]MBC5844116.1 site-specific DNA-methyltransferase [Flavobacterium muglaense]
MSLDKITKGDELTQSLDIVNDNIARLKELFPEVLTEGKIDFKVLQDILGKEIEEEEEYYRFTWAGKAQARREAHKPSTGTLRPAKDESVNWDTTENLYIEGDNLEVLKLLQKSYNNMVKMIYIDPPYNTGNDFVYKDNYKDNLKNYQQISGQIDDEGNKLSTNTDTNGRYHSNWLNMMYPRLSLARNLLNEEGIIFISIDDKEVENLKKLSHEIFGEENFIGCIVRTTGQTTGQDSEGLGSSFDYFLVYSKTSNRGLNGLPLTEHDLKRFENEDEKGKYAYDQMRKTGSSDKRTDRPNMYYPVIDPDGNEVYPIGPGGYESRWRFENNTFKRFLEEGLILWKKTKKDDSTVWWPYVKYYLEGRTKRPSPLWNDLEGNKKASRDLRTLFNGKKIFDFPKPLELIERIITISCDKTNDIILDFFSGSATTAHAVMQINSKDGGKRKYIQVQLPEAIDEKSEAFKEGYTNIAEIGKERIRRAGKLIVAKKLAEIEKLKSKNSLLEEDQQEINRLQIAIANLDLGFKVFKLDSSNIKGWDGNPDNLVDNLFDSQDNIKTGRTEEDVLFEILLKYGLDLTLPIEEKIIEGKKVFSIGFGALFICLADGITNKVAEGIGAWKEALNPEVCRVIFKDSGFGDVEKTNSVQTLKRFGINEIKSI